MLMQEVIVETEISDSDLRGIVKDTANPLQELKKAIIAMPDIDSEKVQAVINKLHAQGGLEILGTEEERLASAQRIAKQILNECSDIS